MHRNRDRKQIHLREKVFLKKLEFKVMLFQSLNLRM